MLIGFSIGRFGVGPPFGRRASAAESPEVPAETGLETVLADARGFVVSLAFAPDGRLFYTVKGGFAGQRTAEVGIVQNGHLQEDPFLTTTVETDGERGLIGFTLDPNFSTNHYVYVFKTTPAAETTTGLITNQVVRYTEDPLTQTARPASATVIFEVPIDPPSTAHNGGSIHFGPDGKLYVTIGDGAVHPEGAQNLGSPKGKIHRLNPDGSIPTDNPFRQFSGALPSIWTFGHRNSFDFTFDPLSGQMFFTENGPNCDDHIYPGRAGGYYSWPTTCGQLSAGAVQPLYTYGWPTVAPTGIDVYQGPIRDWSGDLFWCSYVPKTLTRARFDSTRTAFSSVEVVPGVSCDVAVRSGPDGALYFSSGNSIKRLVSRSTTVTPTPTITPTPMPTLTFTPTPFGTPAQHIFVPFIGPPGPSGW